MNGAKIILGSAGWGLPYGLRGLVPTDSDLASVLARARELGIREIDTAPAYGASEARVAQMLAGPGKGFLVRSKVSRASLEAQNASVLNTKALFGASLILLQFHNYEPSDGERLCALGAQHRVPVGATTYGAENARSAFASFGRVQAEWNVLNPHALVGFPAERERTREQEVSVRSVLLQGLLAGAPIPHHLRLLAPPVQKLSAIALELGLSLPALAIAAALHSDTIDRVLVGVDAVQQLEPIVEAFSCSRVDVVHALHDFRFVADDPRILDPRAWPQLAEKA